MPTSGQHFPFTNFWSSSSNLRGYIPFPTEMRDTPAFGYLSGSFYNQAPTTWPLKHGMITYSSDYSSTTGVLKFEIDF